MDFPRVSFIIPCYNAERSLKRCVDSVSSQTCADFESILVDDGSVDGTSRICDEIAAADSRFKIIHQRNAGLSAARNAGLNSASGANIFFLDSDDYIAPDLLQILLNRREETQADIVIGGLRKVSEEGSLLSSIKLDLDVCDERGYWEQYYSGAYRSEEHAEYVVSCGKLFSRSLFSHERFDEGKLHEDEFIIHRLIAASEIISFAAVDGYRYVQSGDSIMHSRGPKSYLNAAEAFIMRASHFLKKGWVDFAAMALSESRGSLANYLVCKGGCEYRDDYALQREAWAELYKKVAGEASCSKENLYSAIFFASPRLYNFLRRAK